MKDKHNGFTIVELLIVIAILSLLAAWLTPKLFMGLGKAKRDIARAKMATIENALALFNKDCGRYPDDSEGLEVLTIAPDDVEEKWGGPYLKQSDLLDSWENPYDYIQDGEINPGMYDLISYGADGQEGGEDDNADIYNE